MFHNIKKENIPAKKDEKELIDQTIDHAIESYCPIIFIDEDETLEYDDSNTISPQIMTTITNTGAIFNTNLPSLPFNHLYCLEDSSIALTKYILVNRIKEETLITIMSVLDNLDACTENIFIKYFDLRNCIAEALNAYHTIDDLVLYFIHSGIYSINDIDKVDETKMTVDMMASNIFTAIMLAVNCGVNKSIDDTIFRIHLIPNIMNLKDFIIKKYEVPKADQSDDRFWVLANVSLKNTINSALQGAAYPVIFENVNNILKNCCNSNFFVYKDAISEKNRKKHEERQAQRAALKNKNIEDVEF